MLIDGVQITADFPCEREELANYVAYVKERVPNVTTVKVNMCEDGKVDVSYVAHNEKFERIRRITGKQDCRLLPSRMKAMDYQRGIKREYLSETTRTEGLHGRSSGAEHRRRNNPPTRPRHARLHA